MRRKIIGLAGAAAIAASALVAVPGTAGATPATTGQQAQAPGQRPSAIAKKLRKQLNAAGFGEVLDTKPPGTQEARSVRPEQELNATRPELVPQRSAAAAKPIHQQPQLDVTVLKLNKKGKLVSSGTVLTSPKYAKGVVVPVDKNFHTDKVRYRQWDTALWYDKQGQGQVDVVPGRENAPIDFMSTYPASVLKLMVGFGILQMVDNGDLKLDDTYAYQPTSPSSLCGGATTRTIRDYFDRMITVSENAGTCSLIKLMHDRQAIGGLNKTFQDYGLETLQVNATNPANGGNWTPAITMTSLDTAKLLALVNGVQGKAWTAPNGKPVKGKVLSKSSRAFFQKVLGEQAWNNVLSTTNYCGYSYPGQGLRQRTPKRWIGPDGKVKIGDDPDGKYDHSVRPCDKAAQVKFAHKTGLTEHAAGDAGIVHSLPGKAKRDYIIVSFSNLGYRYVDPNRPTNPPIKPAMSRTEKFAKLGRAMDKYLARR